jgi:hypothetical protein
MHYFGYVKENYKELVLFFSLRLAAFAALFSFRFFNGVFFIDFSFPSFSFDILLSIRIKPEEISLSILEGDDYS